MAKNFVANFVAKIQIGKKGLREGIIDCLAKSFKTRELVKISILKSCSREKEKIKAMAEEICRKLERITNKKYVTKIIGFTIEIKKLKEY